MKDLPESVYAVENYSGILRLSRQITIFAARSISLIVKPYDTKIHAYVRTRKRKGGVGTKLLHSLTENQEKPILIGTWKDARWAIDFYLKNGFREVTEEEKNILLKKYWNIPQRQVEASTVLTNR